MADNNLGKEDKKCKGGNQLQKDEQELDTWKAKLEKAQIANSRLLLEKMEMDEMKIAAHEEMMNLVKTQDDDKKEFTKNLAREEEKISEQQRRNQELLQKLRKLQAKLEAERERSVILKKKFKVCVPVPDTNVNFTCQHQGDQHEGGDFIRGEFVIRQTPSVLLQGGQALITFEEETVASQILKMALCSVPCEDVTVNVEPQKIEMEPWVQFEVHLNVSTKELKVSNIQAPCSQGRMEDRLQISLSKPSRGGGEVENLVYDEETDTAHVTFLHPGVAERLVIKGGYPVDLDTRVHVQVDSVYQMELRRFQTFSASPKRTVLLANIKQRVDKEELLDHLEIYFQKPGNCGGEIENIHYESPGGAVQALFSNDTVKTEN